MRNLIAFFSRYYFFFLFVIIETIALTIFINNNNYPNTLVINSANHFTGFINSIYTNSAQYFSLRSDNDQLARENVMLRNQLDASYLITDTLTFYSRDSAYRFIPARVISNSVNKRNNYFMINKGTRHGLDTDMGVISPQGVSGIVVAVSSHYSTVMSLLHKDAKLSTKIKKNDQLASVVWDGKNYQLGLLQDIPTHIMLYRGDSIVTSGYSFIFPEGLPVGTVKKYERETESNLNSAIIWFSTDFNSINHVYVVQNLMLDQQQELLEGITDE
ncbi:MAG: rod shape-determining protein MreC [Bacteroidota bacterium]|nr:rod shape-determining protein MreC [Bacteroidota bacterium]